MNEITKIYKKHSKYIYSIALKIVKNIHDAEDITQNVFLKLHYALSQFKNESDIKTYLYRITINSSIDFLRKEKRQKKLIEKSEITSDKSYSNIFFNMLFDKMPMEQKIPILLSEIGGFSYKEISKILDIPEGTVKSRINRGINKLKDYVR